jgi:hypothetical protein
VKTCRKKLHQYEEHLSRCPECRKDFLRNNKDKRVEYIKKYISENKEKVIAYRKAYKIKNKEIISEKNKIYRLKNREKMLEWHKNNYIKNKNKILQRMKENNSKEETKARRNEYEKKRRIFNPIYNVKYRASGLIYHSFKRKKWSKKTKTHAILGCDFEKLKYHLESTAVKNYGSFDPSIPYEIDHIIPAFLARNEDEMIKLNHYSNLQYLTKQDNLIKSKKVFDNNGLQVLCPIQQINILENFLQNFKY